MIGIYEEKKEKRILWCLNSYSQTFISRITLLKSEELLTQLVTWDGLYTKYPRTDISTRYDNWSII